VAPSMPGSVPHPPKSKRRRPPPQPLPNLAAQQYCSADVCPEHRSWRISTGYQLWRNDSMR